MKTFKKVLALLLVVALTATATVSMTLAYLQDEDEAVNVMTLGNVDIEQIEQEQDGNGGLKDFKQNKPLYPAVYPGDAPEKDADGLYTAPNVVDKIVSVKNTGTSDAYVRTVFAYELGSASEDEWKDLIIRNTTGPWIWTDIGTAVIDGVNYYLVEALYPTALAAKAATENSLLQVCMSKKADNEDVAKLDANGNGTYDILVMSQAIQTQGFADFNGNGTAADDALDEGFYDVSATQHPWTNGVYIPAYSPKAEIVDGVITLENGEICALYGVNEPVTVKGEGTLELHDVTINTGSGSALTVEGTGVKLVAVGNVSLTGAENGIYVPADTKLDLSGKGGSLTAVGGGGVDSTNGGSGIGGEGEIYIHDLKELTAKGYGVAGFGIGGNTAKITIENTNIDYVKGGYVQSECIKDPKYGKDEPEGGAAIGSMCNGAVITLNNVVIDKAEGGSKSAGIGARYWTGVTVNITDSTIKNVIGGNASAGIGGSRVSNGATDGEKVTINITNSTVTAKGGQFGAGIGSGYDTHCQSNQPACTINIDNSAINAAGGKYAAGVGTGYHNAALSGEIKNSTVTAVSGEKWYKDAYTLAQDIGFGVVDPAREGAQTDSKLIYNGTAITIPQVITITEWVELQPVSADTTVKNMVANDYAEICHKSSNLVLDNVTFKNGLTIYTNEVDNNGTVTLKNCTIYLNNGNGDPDNGSLTQHKNGYGLNLNLANGSDITFVFENCTFTAADGYTYTGDSGYNVYIGGGYSAKSITFTGCTFEGSGKHGIGCSSEGSSQYYDLTVTGCNFKNWNNNPAITNGAAVRGNLPAANFAANINISGNTFGNSNNSTQKTVAIDSWTGSWN